MHSTEGHSVLTVISVTVGNHGVERKGTEVTTHMNICSNMHSLMCLKPLNTDICLETCRGKTLRSVSRCHKVYKYVLKIQRQR